jgi:hypothetical protein
VIGLAARSDSLSFALHNVVVKTIGRFLQMAIIHHMSQNIGRVGAIAEVPNFVRDQNVRMSVGSQRLLEEAVGTGVRQILDEFGGDGAKGLEVAPKPDCWDQVRCADLSLLIAVEASSRPA